MKIKTITCHHVYNYGATLQAYALQTYLESLGCDVGIIDYRLPLHTRYELTKPFPLGRYYELTRWFPLLNYLTTPLRNRWMLNTWGRKKAFDRFDHAYLHITPTTYRNINEIRKNPPQADVYIAGSDQIWNTSTPNGTNPGYYLDFGDDKVKRISYAASFGVKEIADEQSRFVRNQMARFDEISVREASGIDILRKLGIAAVRCADPVFLLSREEWMDKLGLKAKEEDYIMVYDFTHDDTNIQGFVKALAEVKGLKTVAVNDFENTPYADIQVNNAGPIEFLQYVLSARYVVANSFHATAFSLIFHKQFATFPLVSQPNPSRMTDLLASVNMLERFKPTSVGTIDEPVQWSVTDSRLNDDVRSSKLYLRNCLNKPIRHHIN